MLKEFQNYAEKVLKETNTTHKVVQTFTVDGRRMSDEIYVKDLPSKLEEIGYYLAVRPEKDGYTRLYSPSIKMSSELGHPSRPYGYIPEDVLEIIKD